MNHFTSYEISLIDKGWKKTNKNVYFDKNHIKRIRVCAYLRKSQEDVKDNSLKLQLDEINKFINEINKTKSYEYEFYLENSDIFKEDNVSGMQGRLRPEFDRMLKFIEDNPGFYGVCIVYKLDRFSRKLEDTLSFITLLSKNSCVLKALDFEDNGDPSSALLRGMLGIVAQYHAQNSAATSIKGTIKKVEENKAVGLLPFGLISEKQKNSDINIKGASNIVIDEAKAHIIKEIFEKYALGFSINDIINYLNEHGYKNKFGRSFTRGNIKYILQNKRYNGTYVYADPKYIRKRKYDNGVKKPEYYIKPNAFPKIIDDDLFNKVQLILNSKKSSHQLSNNITNNYLLTGYLICGVCGKKLHGWSRSKSNNKKYYDYVCSTHKNNRTLCPTKRINKEYLDNIIINITTQILNEIIDLSKDDVDFLIKNKLQTIYKEINIIEKEILKDKDKISRLIDRILTDENNTSLYNLKIKEIELINEQRNIKLNDLNNKLFLTKKELHFFINKIKITKETLLYNITSTKIIIGLIIDKIIVTNESISIKLKEGLSNMGA